MRTFHEVRVTLGNPNPNPNPNPNQVRTFLSWAYFNREGPAALTPAERDEVDATLTRLERLAERPLSSASPPPPEGPLPERTGGLELPSFSSASLALSASLHRFRCIASLLGTPSRGPSVCHLGPNRRLCDTPGGLVCLRPGQDELARFARHRPLLVYALTDGLVGAVQRLSMRR